MSHRIVECPGCLARLKVRHSTSAIQFECPRCGEHVVVAPEAPASGLRTSSAAEEPAARRPSPGGGRRSSGSTSSSTSRSRPADSRPARNAGSGTGRSKATGGRSTSSGRSRSENAWQDDYEEFESTYHNADQLPPRRSTRTHSLSAEDRRAQQENRIFLGVLAAGALVLLTGGYFGFQWLTSDGVDTEAQVAQQDEPNSFAAATQDQTAVSTPEPAASAAVPAAVAAAESPPVTAFTPPPAADQASTPPAFALPGTVQNPPPSAAAPGAVNVSSDGRRLRYEWKPGAEHLYQINISAGAGEDVYRVNGSCSYTVKGDAGAADDEEGSGSGFVVSADGCIATCAHVVEGARQIEVVLLGLTYPATVIAVDAKNDVALIRINASGLPVVPVSDSSTVQTAEDVRVIGFPLSDVLGTGVKVTTGTVSGVVIDAQRGQRIQVDAPINPGNSGGPVVNSSAQVIGIASAKLAGSSVSSVGFVSPSNNLKALMSANGIPVAGASGGGIALAGPEIARRVTPSVAYIRVRGSSGGRLSSVTYSASFTETKPFDPSRMRFGAFPTMPSHTSDRGQIRVNAMGEILEYSGEEHLPFVLGPVGLFFVERLSPYSETSWQHEEESTLTRIKRNERGGPMGRGFGPPRGFGRPPGFGPPGFGPPGFGSPFDRGSQDEVIDTIPAIERISYQTGQELNGRISIRKTYEFTTTRNPQAPYMKIRGTGTVVFDTTVGMPHSLDYEATLESNDEDGNSRFPVKVSYNLRDPEEVKREREAAQQKHKELQEKQEKEKTTPDPQLVEQLLDEIRKAEGGIRASSPFGKLASIAIVEGKRQQVLTVARKHLRNSNGFVVKSAAEAFAHWATQSEFDDLLEILKNKDGMMYTAHQKVVATMADFDDPRVYPILIEAMNHSFVVDAAKKAMIQVGAPMEEVILKEFSGITDARAKRELLEVLKKVGTMKSESFLEKLATGPDFSLRHNAQQALDAIRAR